MFPIKIYFKKKKNKIFFFINNVFFLLILNLSIFVSKIKKMGGENK